MHTWKARRAPFAQTHFREVAAKLNQGGLTLGSVVQELVEKVASSLTPLGEHLRALMHVEKDAATTPREGGKALSEDTPLLPFPRGLFSKLATTRTSDPLSADAQAALCCSIYVEP